MIGILESKEYGKSPNTFIGNQGNIYPTLDSLATALTGITWKNIYNFSVDENNDISCYIDAPYTISAKFSSSAVTYYDDVDGMCTHFAGRCFRSCGSLLWVNFPGLQYCTDESFLGSNSLVELNFPELLEWTGSYAGYRNMTNLRYYIAPKQTKFHSTYENWFQNCPSIELVYTPRLVQIGGTVGQNGTTMNQAPIGTKIFADPFMETCNAGNIEGELKYARDTKKAIVTFVDDFTPPEKITNVQVVKSFPNAVQLQVTTPNSIRPVEYYTSHINGRINSRLFKDPTLIYVEGLQPDTEYNVQVSCVDSYYNRSELSDTIVVKTSAILNTELQDYIEAVGITDQAVKDELTYMVDTMKAEGIWDLAKVIYPIIGNSYEQFRYNLKDPRASDRAMQLQPFGTGMQYRDNGYFGATTNANFFEIDLRGSNLPMNNYHLTCHIQNGYTGTAGHTSIQSYSSTSSMIRLLLSGKLLYNDGYDDLAPARLTAPLTFQQGVVTVQRDDVVQKNFVDGALATEDADGLKGTRPTNYFRIYATQAWQDFVLIGKTMSDAQVITLHTLIERLNTVLNRN
jgi:hypothetical protein